MKKIKVAVSDTAFNKQLKAILLPLEYEIEEVELTPQLADVNFDNTDLIIIDPFLGGVGEAEGLIDTLKSRAVTSRIPILLCSHSDNGDAIVNGLGAGASDFILLPASARMLTSRITALLKK